MKERPILMSKPMVCSLLREENPKTQTRRIAKLRGDGGLVSQHEDWRFCEFHGDEAVWQHRKTIRRVITEKCPYGVVGDRLWVRETHWINESEGLVAYRANEEFPEHMKGEKWKPSIFMPRWASRITLEITEVGVERLQNISEEDAVAEGIESIQGGTHLWMNYSIRRDECDWFRSPIDSYRSLWESINGKDSWSLKNPWVWVVSFRRIDG